MLERFVGKPLKEMATRFNERQEEKTRQEVKKIFWDIFPEDLDRFMNSAIATSESEDSMTRFELLIKAVLENLDEHEAAKYQSHPHRVVKFVADVVAGGRVAAAMAKSLNQRSRREAKRS